MSKRKRMIVWFLVSIVTATSAAVAIEKTRSANQHNHVDHVVLSPAATPNTQGVAARGRNLSLQPEAIKLSRRLGRRFVDSRQSISLMSGTLTLAGKSQALQLTRKRNERGERVEIAVANEFPLLTWDEREGGKATTRAPNETERALIEQLVMDSADQFVLAQLRGASYYTVAKNVRPADAGESDSYAGPLWRVVRVDDPDRDSERKPRSSWRLYYINATTGLIDKIVCEVDGQQTEASFSGWVTQEGETVANRIVWTRDGQTIMELNLNTAVRHTAQEGI